MAFCAACANVMLRPPPSDTRSFGHLVILRRCRRASSPRSPAASCFASMPAACAARVIACVVWLPPWPQVFGRFFDGVAPRDVALSPSGMPSISAATRWTVEHRFGAEIADARLDRHAAVGLDHEQAVESHRAGRVGADGDADAAHLRSVALAAPRLPLVPPEQLGALVERLLQERARRVVPRAPARSARRTAPCLRAR